MTNPTSDHPITPDQELLVAYLDGELDAEAAERVERRLGEDEAFRQQLRSMQEAWDLLDALPQNTLDEKFTQTTVEMAAVQIANELEQDSTKRHWRQTLRKTAPWAALVACGLFGFASISGWKYYQEQQILGDLPVVERIDQYSHLDSIEFLQALAATDLFETLLPEEAPRDNR